MPKKKLFTPWSSLGTMLGRLPSWWPEDEQQRIAAYEKYDQMYWNDPTQYALRVLEGEQPLYIPNARTIVDTTAHYLMKGLQVGVEDPEKNSEFQAWLNDFLKRERFYSTFHHNKQSGIARGDWAFHITADPTKAEGTKVSLTDIHPGNIWPVTDPDDPDEVIRMHLVKQYVLPDDPDKKIRIRRLTYHKIGPGHPDFHGKQYIAREEAIWELTPEWWGPKPEKVREILPYEPLPDEIDQFPVYWYKNIDWQSQDYGSSELRGLEFLEWAVSQGATDTEMALALEGLGVYATDGGRPVNEDGEEEDWEVAPGKVMEVPSGSYFRRVEGVGSITPMMDQINYLESKMREATALSDVALGRVDVQVAESGIALAIRFMPTLAKLEHRDVAGVEKTQQMFYDLKKWWAAYERKNYDIEVKVSIAESKLPKNRDTTVNELNNMIDRHIISRKHYRREMIKLGYTFPDNIEAEIDEELKKEAEQKALAAPQGLQQNAEDAATGKLPPPSNPNNGREPAKPNQSNNKNRPNESAGTESGQTLRRQARGGRS